MTGPRNPLPAFLSLYCPHCTTKLTQGLPLVYPDDQENLTACPKCERAYVFDASVVLRPLALEAMPPEKAAQARRLHDIVRALQGKPALHSPPRRRRG